MAKGKLLSDLQKPCSVVHSILDVKGFDAGVLQHVYIPKNVVGLLFFFFSSSIIQCHEVKFRLFL